MPATVHEPDLYIDDGLSMGSQPKLLTAYTHEVTDTLVDKGFVLSEKSNMEAAMSQVFIGKTYQNGKIFNTDREAGQASDALLHLSVSTLSDPFLFGDVVGGSYLCSMSHRWLCMSSISETISGLPTLHWPTSVDSPPLLPVSGDRQLALGY